MACGAGISGLLLGRIGEIPAVHQVWLKNIGVPFLV